jgi:3-hydroxymyristoyl/3-hydroxydecanoyl-(acyl carrier protein) dehydratase
MNDDFGKYNKIKVIEKNEKSVTLEFSIPETSPYFDGHFPGFPILPAVAQVDLVVRFASEHFGISIDISKINRIKFLDIIRPENPLVLFIEADNRKIVFKISSPGGETIYSSGVMTINQ